MVEQSVTSDTSTTKSVGRSVESDTIPNDGSIAQSKPIVNQKTEDSENSSKNSVRDPEDNKTSNAIKGSDKVMTELPYGKLFRKIKNGNVLWENVPKYG